MPKIAAYYRRMFLLAAVALAAGCEPRDPPEIQAVRIIAESMKDYVLTEVEVRERVIAAEFTRWAHGDLVPDEMLTAMSAASGLRRATAEEMETFPEGIVMLGITPPDRWRGDTLFVYASWGGRMMQVWGRECDFSIHCPDGECVLLRRFNCGWTE